jgi:hypothetical protein
MVDEGESAVFLGDVSPLKLGLSGRSANDDAIGVNCEQVDHRVLEHGECPVQGIDANSGNTEHS